MNAEIRMGSSLGFEHKRRSLAAALKHAGSDAGEKTAGQRRINARFTRRLAVSYETLEPPMLSGQRTGETLNIGSKGLLFTSNDQFRAGQLVQVSLDWPVRLDNQVRLKLVAAGRIVRSVNGQTDMTIDKYEFRTRRVAAKPQASHVIDSKSSSSVPRASKQGDD
jgi:hypothetical protein